MYFILYYQYSKVNISNEIVTINQLTTYKTKQKILLYNVSI